MDLPVHAAEDRLRLLLVAHHRSGVAYIVGEATLDVAAEPDPAGTVELPHRAPPAPTSPDEGRLWWPVFSMPETCQTMVPLVPEGYRYGIASGRIRFSDGAVEMEFPRHHCPGITAVPSAR